MSSKLFALLLVTIVVALMTTSSFTFTLAAVTDNSVLSCDTDDVLPAKNITCRIYLRDELQEPTTSNNAASLFSIRVLSDIGEAATIVSPVQITKDPTIVIFTVSSNIGTRLRIDGYVSATGLPIRNTGAVVLVLEVPATKFGDITCDSGDSLSFRATTRCVASATGIHGLPAFVTQSNFFLSEEHGDGSFQFINGNRALQFSYTAPTFPSMTYSTFLFRLGLLSSTGSVLMETTLSLKVVYPQRPPTSFSRLRCGSATDVDESNNHRCFLSALDSLGPVALNTDDFIVEVKRKRIDTAANAVLEGNTKGTEEFAASSELIPASEVSWEWTKGGNSGVSILSFNLAKNAYVFDGQITVRLRNSDAGSGNQQVRGSPAMMGFGFAPTPTAFNLVRCSRTFAVAGKDSKSILCFVSVTPSVTPDPRYLSVETELGSITCKRMANASEIAFMGSSRSTTDSAASIDAAAQASSSSSKKSILVVCYQPPASISSRRESTTITFSALSTVLGKEVSISGNPNPVKITLYPSSISSTTESDTRVAALVSGILLFGSVLIVGIYFNFKHAAAKQKSVHRLAEHQRHALEHTVLRPLFRTAGGNSVNMIPQASTSGDSKSAFSPTAMLNLLKPAGSVNNLSDEEMKAFGRNMSGGANANSDPTKNIAAAVEKPQ